MKRRVLLQVEELGERILPSAPAPTLPPLQPLAPSPAQMVQFHHLKGTGRGTFTRTFGELGTPTQFHFQGAGSFAYLGRVKITGDVQSGGLQLFNHVRGTFTLRNLQGSVTFAVTGMIRSTSGMLPGWLRYHVVSGSGMYAHWQDYGVLVLAKKYMRADGGIFQMTIG